MALRNKLGLNIGASLFSSLTYALVPLVSVPLFLCVWGKERYGAWLVLSAIPAWLTVSDLGFGSVAANEMSLCIGRGDVQGANRSLQSAWVVIMCVTVIGMLAVTLMTLLIPWSEWLGIEVFGAHEVSVAMILLSATTFAGFYGTLFMGMLRADGRAAAAFFWSAFKPVSDLSFLCISLAIKAGVVGVSLALLLSQLVFLLSYGIYAIGSCKDFHLGVRYCSMDAVRYCLRKGLAFCLFPLGNAFFLQGSLLAVNAALGDQSVVVFGTARTLTRSVRQVINIINQSTWPEFSHLFGAQDWERTRRLHRLSVQISLFASVAMIMGLVGVGPWMYGWWTANHLTIDRTLLVLFLLPALTNSLWFTSSVVLIASNRHEALAWRYILGSIITVPACYYLSRIFGISGAAISLVPIDILLIFYVVKASIFLSQDTWYSFFISLFDIKSLRRDLSLGRMYARHEFRQ